MKKIKEIGITLLYIVLGLIVGFFVCENRLLKEESEFETLSCSLEAVSIYNMERIGNSVTIAEDPQIVIEEANQYVDSILLQDTKTTEEIQVFYCEGEENFSEEKSIRIVPKLTKQGVILELEKEVTALRVDFTGAIGTTYEISEIVLNPDSYLEWTFGVGCFCAIVGIMFGICLRFLIKEGKYFKVYIQVLKKYRFLLEDMVTRDIKLKYRRSVVGLLWSILNPLLMMVVITAVFQNLFRFEIEHFAVYYLTGWVVYNFVTEATNGAMTSIISSSALIRKVYIPKYIFPMQKCVFSFVNMLFSLVALFVVMLVLQVKITWYVLLIPIPLFLALIFAMGLGMILSTVAVFFRDMIHLYGIFTMVWMYLTPIIYPEEILVGVMQTIMKLNPLYYYVDYFRHLTLYGTLPQIENLWIMVACSIVSFLLGVAVFKKKQDRFILYI